MLVLRVILAQRETQVPQARKAIRAQRAMLAKRVQLEIEGLLEHQVFP